MTRRTIEEICQPTYPGSVPTPAEVEEKVTALLHEYADRSLARALIEAHAKLAVVPMLLAAAKRSKEAVEEFELTAWGSENLAAAQRACDDALKAAKKVKLS